MTYRCCPNCRSWYDKKQGDCACGEPAPRHNKWLRTASLNAQLYQSVENSQPKVQARKLTERFKTELAKA